MNKIVLFLPLLTLPQTIDGMKKQLILSLQHVDTVITKITTNTAKVSYADLYPTLLQLKIHLSKAYKQTPDQATKQQIIKMLTETDKISWDIYDFFYPSK